MKKFVVAAVCVGLLAFWAWGTERLVVYTYRSFVRYGPAAEIKRAFEAQFPGVELVWVAPAGASEMLGRLIAELEAGGTEADVFLGISSFDLVLALSRGVFQPYDPALIPNLAFVPEELRFDPSGHVVPFDHGYITFVAWADLDERLVPQTLADLVRPELKGKVILQDPRTSSTGRAFLLWTIAHFGEEWPTYWKQLLGNVLTVTRGWSEAFAMFEAREAPILLSYSTDAAYAYIVGGEEKYRVVTPDGEGYRYLEGMGIVRTTTKLELAHAFLNLVLSKEIQELIPTSQWMFPVHREAALPADFARLAVVPNRPVFLDPTYVAENLEEWLNTWQQLLVP